MSYDTFEAGDQTRSDDRRRETPSFSPRRAYRVSKTDVELRGHVCLPSSIEIFDDEGGGDHPGRTLKLKGELGAGGGLGSVFEYADDRDPVLSIALKGD